jgi:alkanesulfonate monooxygenase SsuD/methylene tetrahydromethanopterin reductase-like flavin-dependent oxidoreductase (luciferase family)
VTVAERYATLDHGRLEFGIGRDVPTFEWNKFRAEPFEQGRDIMYEALEVVLSAGLAKTSCNRAGTSTSTSP